MDTLRQDVAVMEQNKSRDLWLNCLIKMIDGLDISITIMTIALLQLIRANCGWFACGATSRPVLCCYVLCVMLPLSMPTARPTRPINAHKLHDCLPAESFHNVRLRIVDGAV